MPHCRTRYFGRFEYQPEWIIEFPAGIAGFPGERHFLAITDPAQEPLVFLQSLETAGLCFLTLPVMAIDPGYELKIGPEELAALGLGVERQPSIGAEVLALAMIALSAGGTVTANLLAPVVVNLALWRARASGTRRCGLRLPPWPGDGPGACIMLILRRRAGESILIGDEVEIEVLEISSKRATLGIRAPQRIPVLRKEIRLTEEENRAAARGVPPELLGPVCSRLRPAFPGNWPQTPTLPHR